MKVYSYYRIVPSKQLHKGERYFRLSYDSDSVTQICVSPGEIKKGKGNLYGITLISRLTFLSNYYQYKYVAPCKESVFEAKFREVVKILS